MRHESSFLITFHDERVLTPRGGGGGSFPICRPILWLFGRRKINTHTHTHTFTFTDNPQRRNRGGLDAAQERKEGVTVSSLLAIHIHSMAKTSKIYTTTPITTYHRLFVVGIFTKANNLFYLHWTFVKRRTHNIDTQNNNYSNSNSNNTCPSLL